MFGYISATRISIPLDLTMQTIRLQFDLRLRFGGPIRLIDVERRRSSLPARGVYLLVKKSGPPRSTGPFAPEVIYIGKANRESMFSRCRKHLWTVQDARLTSGKPKTAPGKAFKVFRETIANDPSRLWIVPADMTDVDPFLISCAEEYLLYRYRARNTRLPLANSVG